MSEPTAEIDITAETMRTHLDYLSGCGIGEHAMTVIEGVIRDMEAYAVADREVEELARVLRHEWHMGGRGEMSDEPPSLSWIAVARAAKAHLIPDRARVIGPEVIAATQIALRGADSIHPADQKNIEYARKWFGDCTPMPSGIRVARAWDSLADVPHDVEVRDRQGCTWTPIEPPHRVRSEEFELSADWDTAHGPFTEVLP
ncbi:hypothetical protein G4X40_18645 [Rhodococcus sp. D2-41]|uniref:hypothetical protein n=1 Tax=Speluncibacter jeojiensis TaxID=2710754 RepID=UPI00241065A0|nr:hypothetical protein [Rhodococcus sp. D2-41]MDG3012165.1 hypothetical protein [Rhodococcus sp. D2-41]